MRSHTPATPPLYRVQWQGQLFKWHATLRALLLVCLLLCWQPSAAAGARVLTQQGKIPSGGSAEALANAAVPRPITVYQEFQETTSDVLEVYQVDTSIRLLGSRFVPFSVEDQAVVIQAIEEVALPYGPLVLTGYKEYYPDPAAPPEIQEALPLPGVEFSFGYYWVLNASEAADAVAEAAGQTSNQTAWENMGTRVFDVFIRWSLAASYIGGWDVPTPQLISVTFTNMLWQPPVDGGFILHPLIVMDVLVGVQLAEGSQGELTAQQASAVQYAVEGVLMPRYGTMVEVVNYTASAVKLEVTMFRCRDNATLASPECEEQLLGAVLAQLQQDSSSTELLGEAGIKGVEVQSITQRQPPPPPDNSSAADAPQPWVPWTLDRIDQRSLPLDGRFTANATGRGVNVNIVSSGVYAEHDEFKYPDGSPGNRVKAEWGYKGLSPTEDCPDSDVWYAYGTFAASVCCGLTLGPAKDASIHSIRFRDRCLRSSSSTLWGPGALPSALDLILSSFESPSVVLMDAWFFPGTTPEALEAKQAILDRLDKFLAANITIIGMAGPENGAASPCENIIASHPAVISVAATDTYDQRTAFGPWNSSCIDVWAPSGGLGTGIWGASPSGPSNYTRIINRAYGAAALAAGVAAQYLELYPEATPSQLREALRYQLSSNPDPELAIPGIVTGAGTATPTDALIFTDLNAEEAPASPAGEEGGADSGSSGGSSGGGLSTGAIVGIVVVAIVAVTAVAAAALFFRARRARRLRSITSKSAVLHSGAGWEVAPHEIEICKHPDGSDWLLGEGKYGKVYKALKGGVQVVAVKRMAHFSEEMKQLFIKEIDVLKYVSRDANIVQFYGACMQQDDVMLVSEFMEGGDLRNALSADTSRELGWYRRGKDIMLDIVRGVNFLHANHTIHRDIKSKNILLDRYGRAKLADVGLAQVFYNQQEPQESNPKGGFAGTLAWAAPEVMLGEAYCEKVDMFSLGVLLWEVASREIPQRGCLRDVEVPRECPLEVAQAIQACLQRDPAARPSARELYQMLLACPPHGDYGPLAPASSVPAALQQNGAGGGWFVAATRSSSGEESKQQSGSPSAGKLSASGSGQSIGRNASGELALKSLSSRDMAMVSIPFEQVEFCLNKDGKRVELGSGAFGKVYKVLLDGVQPLAVKAVEIGSDPGVQAAFTRESGLLWRLRHPNVVGLVGVSISGTTGYLLMELMEGGSLHKALNLRSRTSGERVFSWYNRGRGVCLEVAKGIHYLHSFKVTHFDIKSGNVLLTRQLNAKVADVGLSRVMSCTHHSFAADSSGPPGTFAYMAPELMAGFKCTQSVDIFSFGILLWETCTGEHPKRGQMEPLQVPGHCPAEVAELYMQCVAVDPAARPSARELVERLAKAAKIQAPGPKAEQGQGG